MGTLLRLALSFFWLAVIPVSCGQLFAKKTPFSWTESFLAGFLFLLALAQVLILPLLLLRAPLHTLVYCYGAVLLLAAAAGIARGRKLRESLTASGALHGKAAWKASFSWYVALAAVLILLQAFVVFYFAHIDQDDAFYVGAATTAVHTDTIFEIDAYTGFPYRFVLKRYVLSPFPILLAVISRLSYGIHPATLAHMVYPPVIVLAGYCALFQLAKRLYPDAPDGQGLFLLFAALLYWFSGYTSRQNGSFLLLRPWQGKAVLAGVLLPLLFWLCLQLFFPQEEGGQREGWHLLFLAVLAACHVSSMGILLAPLLTGICLLAALILRRTPALIWRTVLCCLPALGFAVIYLFL